MGNVAAALVGLVAVLTFAGVNKFEQHRRHAESAEYFGEFNFDETDAALMHIRHGYVYSVADPEGMYTWPLSYQPGKHENFDRAIVHYKKALDMLHPDNPDHKLYIEAAYRGLARCYTAKGDVASAGQAEIGLRRFRERADSSARR